MRLSMSSRRSSDSSTLVGSVYEKPSSATSPSSHPKRVWVPSFLRRLLSTPVETQQCEPELEIGAPTGFAHRVHVGWDPETHGFTGLPEEWRAAFEPALNIGRPYDFEHRVHVGYDAELGGYTGLPAEWRERL
ncbi:hypothetical protein EDC01DRAFT_306418 [Geopyxis carbonaria]|nr:hypothetical protein EDC01DRAFT_306418 [Geopyxis carbonaria]